MWESKDVFFYASLTLTLTLTLMVTLGRFTVWQYYSCLAPPKTEKKGKKKRKKETQEEGNTDAEADAGTYLTHVSATYPPRV